MSVQLRFIPPQGRSASSWLAGLLGKTTLSCKMSLSANEAEQTALIAGGLIYQEFLKGVTVKRLIRCSRPIPFTVEDATQLRELRVAAEKRTEKLNIDMAEVRRRG